MSVWEQRGKKNIQCHDVLISYVVGMKSYWYILHSGDTHELVSCPVCMWFLTIGVVVQTVDAKEGVVLSDLSGSDLCHSLDRVQPAVLSQRHWDYL